MRSAAVPTLALCALAAALAVAAPAAAFDFPQLAYFRVTPDPGVLVDDVSLAQLSLDFNQPVQEAAEGNFSVSCSDSGYTFSASVRSPQAWVRDATVKLLLPKAGVLLGCGTCTATVDAGAYVSSANGSPSPAKKWSFTALEFVAPGRSVVPPAGVGHGPVVDPMLKRLDPSRVNATIDTLSTTWDNRFFQAPSGLAAATWLKGQYEAIAASYGRTDVEVSFHKHAWMMPSTIVRIPGSDEDVALETVVVGGHLDSINRQNWTVNVRTGHAPGANDDASAIALHLELFRVLMAADFRPRRTVELHAYAAEEEGLYGSLDVAAAYARANRSVAFMLQLDQCSYVRDPKNPVMAVFTDNTDPALSRFLTRLIARYCTTPWVWSNEDNRADSDFHSWSMHGYRTSYAAEGVIDDLVYGNSKHTPYDVIDTISLSHAMEFGRLALSFVVELSL